MGQKPREDDHPDRAFHISQNQGNKNQGVWANENIQIFLIVYVCLFKGAGRTPIHWFTRQMSTAAKDEAGNQYLHPSLPCEWKKTIIWAMNAAFLGLPWKEAEARSQSQESKLDTMTWDVGIWATRLTANFQHLDLEGTKSLRTAGHSKRQADQMPVFLLQH